MPDIAPKNDALSVSIMPSLNLKKCELHHLNEGFFAFTARSGHLELDQLLKLVCGDIRIIWKIGRIDQRTEG